MYDYPIFKHLIQFSNLIDAEGKLTHQVPSTSPIGQAYGTTLHAKDEDSSEGDLDGDGLTISHGHKEGSDDNDNEESSENEGGDKESLNQFEGGEDD